MSKYVEKLQVAEKLENCLNEYYGGHWDVLTDPNKDIVEIYKDKYLKYQISIDSLVSDMSVTDLLNHKLDIKPRYPRIFVRWSEDNGDTIKEYNFDVHDSLEKAQEIASHIEHIMQVRNIDYISCYATTIYFM